MNIEVNNAQIKFSKDLCNEKVFINVEGELIVPDIKPDILSISNVDAEVYIRKQEMKDGKLYIEGVTDISAIYIGEDARNSIKSLSNEIEFYKQLEIPDFSDESVVNVKIQKKQIDVKVVNGRKINVYVNIEATVDIIDKQDCVFINEIINDENYELKKLETNFVNFVRRDTQSVEVNESVSLQVDALPIQDILKATMTIKNVDYKLSYNKILVKGEAIVKLIYVADSNKTNIESFETIIPIMGFINSDNINEKDIIKINAGIKEFTIRPIYQDLKSTSFQVEGLVEMYADIYKEEKLEMISDLYNPELNLKCAYKKINIVSERLDFNEEVEVLQGLMISELESIKILEIKTNPRIIEKNVMDGKIAIEGNIDFDVLYFNEIKSIVEMKKVELPYQQVIKNSKIKDGMDVDVCVKIEKIDFRNADTNQLQIKILMNFEANSTIKKELEGIIAIELDNEPITEMPSIVIYYVQDGDLLWSIAKKFRTTVSEIKEYNGLNDDYINKGQQLIIPKRNNVKL